MSTHAQSTLLGYIMHIVYRINHIHSSGSWCTCCSPGDTSHHLAGRCRPVCHHRQSGNQHQWKTPADESRSSSRFVPGKTKRTFSLIIYTFTTHACLDTDKQQQATNEKHTGKAPSYLTDRHLHDGIKATLWRVKVSWDLLLADQTIELVSLVCQLQDVLIAEGAGTVLVPCAGVDEPGWRGADVRHDCLLHKWTETLKESAFYSVL